MKKLANFMVFAICFVLPITMGCSGGEENTVIQAPEVAVDEEPAMEGMTDEEYDAAMDADMEGE